MQANDSSDTRAREVDELLHDWGQDRAPGLAAMVICDGKVLYRKSYGLSDGRTRIKSDTIFELASVTKQFTAMAIMMLRERGMLSYDQTLADIFQQFTSPDAKKIKLVHLINHTSGLPEYEDLYQSKKMFGENYPRSAKSEREKFEPTPADVLELLAGLDHLFPSGDFTPGVKFQYCNSGYTLLSQIIEKVSGLSYPEFLRQNIFEPLAMRESYVFSKDSPAHSPCATSYDRGWSEYHDIDYTPVNFVYGDGNVRSNLKDLYSWNQALELIFNPHPSSGETPLIKYETLTEALATAVTSDTPHISYAFGWFISTARGLEMFCHSGGWAGFKTMIMRFPKQHLAVILLSNVMQFPPTETAARIASVYLKRRMSSLPQIKLDLETMLIYTKRYETDEQVNSFDDYIDITLEPNRPRSKEKALWLKTSDLVKFKLVPAADAGGEFKGEFFMAGLEGFDDFRFSFLRKDDSGRFVLVLPPRHPWARHLQKKRK